MLFNYFFVILSGAIYCHSKATSSLAQLFPRQDTTLAAGPTACRDPDIDTDPQKAFNDANGIDLILDVMEQVGSPAQFPSLLVRQIVNDPSFVFDCTDLSKPENCKAPIGPDGQICTELKAGVTGRSTDAGVVVIQSYVRMYGFLQNSLTAIDLAKVNIEAIKLLDAMATDLKPSPDTAGKILVELLEIAIGFIPIAGPELLFIRTAVKVATKIAKVATKKALKDKDDGQPPTVQELQSYLDQVVTDFKNAITEQHAQMFLLENTDGTGRDNSQAKWLDQGTQLALKVTVGQLTSNMETNLKSVLLANYMGTAKANIGHANAEEVTRPALNIHCTLPTEVFNTDGVSSYVLEVNVMNAKHFVTCDCFGYEPNSAFNGRLEGSQPITASALKDKSDFYGGIQFEQIIKNALACHAKGLTQKDVDINSFLEGSSQDEAIPDCLFGFHVFNLCERFTQVGTTCIPA